MNDYTDVKRFVWTMPGPDFGAQGIFDALTAHFKTAGSTWEVVNEDPGVAFSVRKKVGSTCEIILHRSGAQLYVQVDPGQAVVSLPSGGTAGVSSSQASPLIGSGSVPSGNAARLIVIEHGKCFSVFWSVSTNAYITGGIHAGQTYAPSRPTDAALGLRGHSAHIGSLYSWFSLANSTVQVYDNAGGARQWGGASTDFFMISSGPNAHAGGSNDGLTLVPKGVVLRGASGGNNTRVGEMLFLAYPPIVSGSFGLSPTFGFMEAPGNIEKWMYIHGNTGDAYNIVSFEPGATL